MIAEGIRELKALAVAAGRPSTLQVGHRTYLFNPSLDVFEELPRVVPQVGKVANVECLSAVVLEEARRRGGTSESGEFMTISFTREGAVFSPDDRVRLDEYTYRRVLSAEWQLLRGACQSTYTHKEWIALLSRLRPVMRNGREMVRAFRKLDVSKATRVLSAPTLQDGAAGSGFLVDLAVRTTTGGETSQAIPVPSDLTFDLSYARGGHRTWALEAEVNVELVDDDEKETLQFSLFIPELEAIEGSAVEEEVRWFREATKDLPRLLILENF